MPISRTGYQAVANAIWSLVAVALRAVNTTLWNGAAVATPNQTGYPLVDTRYHRGSDENVLQGGRRDVDSVNSRWNGAAIATPNVAGFPLVDTHHHRGNIENSLQSGRRDVYLGARAVGMLGWKTQQVEASVPFAGASNAQNVTITALTSAAAFVQLDGHHNGQVARIGILNSTTVRLVSHSANDPGTITVSFTVIEGPE